MRRTKIIEAAVVGILLLLLGAYMEFSSRSMDDKNRIIRGSPGSGRQEVELTLNAGEQLKNYDYQVSVPAQCMDEKTAQSYFSRAEKEIDETFFPEGEEAAHVTEQVHMKPSYVKGLVKADWTLDQYNAVDVDGTIREDQLDPKGELVQASVALTCEKYREEYTFSFYPLMVSPFPVRANLTAYIAWSWANCGILLQSVLQCARLHILLSSRQNKISLTLCMHPLTK